MRNRNGMNTSVVFGFVKFLRDIQKREHPDLLGVAFDPPGGSFRRELYPEYKANRAETPEDIILSVPYIKRALEGMCIPILEVTGYEADDVIGTLSQQGVAAGYDVYMVTPDKDYGQLVRDHCRIYKQKGSDGAIELIGREEIRARYGIDDPVLVRDILALWGDASDNIPGVPGIGERGGLQTGSAVGHRRADPCRGAADQGTPGREDRRLGRPPAAGQAAHDDPPRRAGYPQRGGSSRSARRTSTRCGPSLPSSTSGPSSTTWRTSRRPIPCPTDRARRISGSWPRWPVRKSAAAPCGPRGSGHPLRRSGRTVSRGTCRRDNPGRNPGRSLRDNSGRRFRCLRRRPRGPGSRLRRAAGVPLPHGAGHAPRVSSRRVPRSCAGGLGGGPPRGVLLRHGDHGARYLQRPHRRPVAGRGAPPCVVHPLPEAAAAEYADILRPLFEDEQKAKIGQNIKFDLMVLRRLGIALRGPKYDTMILHYLLDPESRHNMNALSERYLGYRPIEIETLIGRGQKQLTMDLVNVERVKEYAAEDADITLQLKQVLYPMVERIGLRDLYFEIEEPMIEVLADIETAGVRIDTAALAEYAVELNRRLAELEAAVRAEAGEPTLNINSTRQLGEVLFAKMRIAEKPKMTRTKQFCTDEEYLQGFARKHRIVDLVLEYRGVKKLLSTYVEALPQLVNRRTGRIHTSFNQAVTATGRLSSTNPNLQNIPVRDALGRRIREAFIPSDDDHLLLSADYSQVELRLMAHLSGDEALIAAFEHGEDIHAATAARLFGKSLAEVTPEERRRAKTANFGIIYGISAFGLSQRLEIPRKGGPRADRRLFRLLSEGEGVHGARRRAGAPRRLRRDDLRAAPLPERHLVAQRRGAGTRRAQRRERPDPGLGGRHHEDRHDPRPPALRRGGIRSRVILQVHDELVVDMLRTEEEQVRRIVTECMEQAAQLKVRLIAEAGVGRNWLEAH